MRNTCGTVVGMEYKTNVHFHSSEDPEDVISYSLYEGIDHAASLGFQVLASTTHARCVVTDDHRAYAEARGMLLISGMEANVYDEGARRFSHVLILNCDRSAEAVRTFADLAAYRASHPECFTIAPHPYFYGNFSLKQRLTQYIDLFDAIEQSWFYTKYLNRNLRAEAVARMSGKPFISTSDTHYFDFMDTNYTLIEAEGLSCAAIFEAIRAHRYTNVTSPRTPADVGTFIIRACGLEFRKLMRTLRPVNTHLPVVPSLEPTRVCVRTDERTGTRHPHE